MTIAADGTFSLRAEFSDARAPELGGQVPATIRIGNDIGQADTPLAAR